ncbi:probable Succinate dehydrogenase [ubiquinone] cytochrome b small subunit, mitochondrial [Cephalotrichum gorgonifer]|uniref:Succinate dehydrogenase [ubiquinone] cytochrome b small subunit n=1 Tax=Cephalotrichum gorgonifer TaxID=2041049 RepID=A0AAE8SUZ0_9PEZI|nr:probable Succinate dehydrogenase [ubiquinone] cytochrome b small subunit, mitochondrial [Cephalotrichum gorgonifer]
MASIARPTLSASRAALRQVAVRRDVTRAAAFHTTSKKQLLPAGPQVVKRTVNDPVVEKHGDPAHGSYHWTFDRALALGLVPLTLAPFAAGSLNPTLDAVLCGGLLVHSHMGFQNIITDYVPSRRYPKSRRALNYGLGAATLLVGVGLYEFETNDVGLTETIKRVWKA